MITRIFPLYKTLLLTAALAMITQARAGEDNCANVVPVPLAAGGSVTLSGNNTTATDTGDFDENSPFFGAAVVWHAFTTTECMYVTYDFCGQNPVWAETWGFLFQDCPGMLPTGPNAFNSTTCPDGNNTYEHWNLPAGTYYIAVPQIPGSIGAYSIQLTGEACPSSAENDFCADVNPVPLSPGVTIEFSGDNSEATFVGDFESTSPVIGAAVVWHAFTTTECMNVSFGFCGQEPVWELTWGFLFTTCPGDQPTGPNAFDTSTCPDGNTTYQHWELPPGTYYLAVPMIDGSTGPYTIQVMGTSCGFPSNDQCQNITPQLLPAGTSLEFVGDNSGATDTNDFIPAHLFTAPVVWHAFTLTGCTDVTISYCGLDPVWANTFGIITTTCPGDSIIQFDPLTPNACPDGNTYYTYRDLLEGTYYIPILDDPGQNSSGPYSITATAVVCLTVGLEEQAKLDWSIFPNPGEGAFTLSNGGDNAIISIEVLDLSGRRVGMSAARIAPHSMGDFNGNGLSSGMYIVRITDSAEQRFEQRLIVR